MSLALKVIGKPPTVRLSADLEARVAALLKDLPAPRPAGERAERTRIWLERSGA